MFLIGFWHECLSLYYNADCGLHYWQQTAAYRHGAQCAAALFLGACFITATALAYGAYYWLRKSHG